MNLSNASIAILKFVVDKDDKVCDKCQKDK